MRHASEAQEARVGQLEGSTTGHPLSVALSAAVHTFMLGLGVLSLSGWAVLDTTRLLRLPRCRAGAALRARDLCCL
jgi:hypothetical protein